MSTSENNGDFVKWLGVDMSIKVFLHLEDPSDLAHVCAVSSSWRQFVITNGLFKKLCFKRFPEMSGVAHVVEVKNMIEPVRARESNSVEWEFLMKNHRVYALLVRGLTPFLENYCIAEAISASSTDNYPRESIWNTLEPGDRLEDEASYWSSKGQSDPAVPEMLVYKLITNLCLVTEICIQPFQAYFQHGYPIYSSKAVRFRLGHPKFPLEVLNDATVDSSSDHISIDDKFIWQYTSPEYPMVQENCLQRFKLPEPVLCIGGILQVELLGRVQRQEMDGLYYICVSHVQVVGRPLYRPFDVVVHASSGRCTLKYCPEREQGMLSVGSLEDGTSAVSHLYAAVPGWIQTGFRFWKNIILSTVLGMGLLLRRIKQMIPFIR